VAIWGEEFLEGIPGVIGEQLQLFVEPEAIKDLTVCFTLTTYLFSPPPQVLSAHAS
jgi:hypothetical protein